MNIVMRWMGCVSMVALLVSCGSRAEVVDSSTDLHLSGNWNDSDSRTVSEEVSKALEGQTWIADFVAEYNRKPVVRIGRIRVRTRALDDIVDPVIFTNDLERALIASGTVRVVANRREVHIQNEERADVIAHAAESTPAAGLVADVILGGTLLTQDDRVLDAGLTGSYKQVKFYQLDISITNLVTNEVLWRGSVERKKTIEQSTLEW